MHAFISQPHCRLVCTDLTLPSEQDSSGRNFLLTSALGRKGRGISLGSGREMDGME